MLNNMFITKKNKETKNEYVLTSTGLWVRSYNNKVKPFDINNFDNQDDYSLFIENETYIKSLNISNIESELKPKSKFIIISDGYEFDKIKHILHTIPKNIVIIGVNRTLAKWKIGNELIQRRMDYFLVNNPYKECVNYLPSNHKYYPKCIISSKTNYKFVENYKGSMIVYSPVFSKNFSGDLNYSQLDDYRNPICAALSMCFACNASKIALLCCDTSFELERPGSIQIQNGLWTYPQSKISHGLIEGCAYWLNRQENNNTKVVDCSKGLEYKEIQYIEIENLIKFFDGE